MTVKQNFSTKTYVWKYPTLSSTMWLYICTTAIQHKPAFLTLHQEKLQEKWPGFKLLWLFLIHVMSPKMWLVMKRKNTLNPSRHLKSLTALKYDPDHLIQCRGKNPTSTTTGSAEGFIPKLAKGTHTLSGEYCLDCWKESFCIAGCCCI